jgi:hypothetical protein
MDETTWENNPQTHWQNFFDFNPQDADWQLGRAYLPLINNWSIAD